MKIIIVDDIQENLYLLESLIKGYGHDVYKASNGQLALEILNGDTKFDLIISDILMPIMDGFEFCRYIKTSEILNNIPFIFYTATYTDFRDKEFALKIGADRFIVKPCEPESLIAAINEILAKPKKVSFEKEKVPAPLQEEKILKQYNECLIRKLEDKVIDLEKEVKARQKAEDRLRQSESRLIKAQRLAKIGDFSWDMNTDKITCSDSLHEMLLYDKSEIIDSTILNLEIYHPDDLERVNQWINNSITSGDGKLPPNEYRVIRKDGVILYVRTTGNIIQISDEKTKIFATIQDITDFKIVEAERAKLQNQLFHSQKLESVGRMTGGIAHDFNNMLCVIKGYAELAMDETKQNSLLRTYLTKIQNAVKSSSEITKHLLAFARKQTILPQVFDLNNKVFEMTDMLEHFIGKNIELVFLQANNPQFVKMDPSQIDQILANLCINASDSITKSGKITIKTDIVSFDEKFCREHINTEINPGDFVLLTVSDTGCGIDKQILDNIFEPFFTTKDTGNGLGLSTVYGIVKQNHGFITVQSKVQKGTTFKIYLPYFINQAAKDYRLSDDIISPSHTKTILLVDDMPDILKIVKSMIEKLNYHVLTAITSADAITLAETNSGQIDLLVTDVVMPEISGLKLSEKLQLISPGIKTLFISGYSKSVLNHQETLPDGMNFLQKPFSIIDLSVKISQALGENEKLELI